MMDYSNRQVPEVMSTVQVQRPGSLKIENIGIQISFDAAKTNFQNWLANAANRYKAVISYDIKPVIYMLNNAVGLASRQATAMVEGADANALKTAIDAWIAANPTKAIDEIINLCRVEITDAFTAIIRYHTPANGAYETNWFQQFETYVTYYDYTPISVQAPSNGNELPPECECGA